MIFVFEIRALMSGFKATHFVHVPREENKEADKLANLALDGKL